MSQEKKLSGVWETKINPMANIPDKDMVEAARKKLESQMAIVQQQSSIVPDVRQRTNPSREDWTGWRSSDEARLLADQKAYDTKLQTLRDEILQRRLYLIDKCPYAKPNPEWDESTGGDLPGMPKWVGTCETKDYAFPAVSTSDTCCESCHNRLFDCENCDRKGIPEIHFSRFHVTRKCQPKKQKTVDG